jgi:predicted nucleotidyltransferase
VTLGRAGKDMKPSEILAGHLEEIQKRYGVTKIGLFGSFVRGEDQFGSDVDILVDFATPVDLFTFLELKEYLESLLNREVDLVTKNALKPLLRDSILSQVTYL